MGHGRPGPSCACRDPSYRDDRVPAHDATPAWYPPPAALRKERVDFRGRAIETDRAPEWFDPRASGEKEKEAAARRPGDLAGLLCVDRLPSTALDVSPPWGSSGPHGTSRRRGGRSRQAKPGAASTPIRFSRRRRSSPNRGKAAREWFPTRGRRAGIVDCVIPNARLTNPLESATPPAPAERRLTTGPFPAVEIPHDTARRRTGPARRPARYVQLRGVRRVRRMIVLISVVPRRARGGAAAARACGWSVQIQWSSAS